LPDDVMKFYEDAGVDGIAREVRMVVSCALEFGNCLIYLISTAGLIGKHY
jgi:hypothetical protein